MLKGEKNAAKNWQKIVEEKVEEMTQNVINLLLYITKWKKKNCVLFSQYDQCGKIACILNDINSIITKF